MTRAGFVAAMLGGCALAAAATPEQAARLMERLGIHDVAGLVRVALRAGLIEPD